MNIFIFLLGILLGAGTVWVIAKRKIKEIEIELKRTEKEKEEEEKIASGLAGFNRQMQEIKEERKRRILEELEGRGKIRANEVADIFTISRTTAFRYLEELEQEGKIEQIGAFGPNVHYRLKK